MKKGLMAGDARSEMCLQAAPMLREKRAWRRLPLLLSGYGYGAMARLMTTGAVVPANVTVTLTVELLITSTLYVGAPTVPVQAIGGKRPLASPVPFSTSYVICPWPNAASYVACGADELLRMVKRMRTC